MPPRTAGAELPGWAARLPALRFFAFRVRAITEKRASVAQIAALLQPYEDAKRNLRGFRRPLTALSRATGILMP